MNKLEILKNTKIYVLCPANTATGGPELLHQLVYKLKSIGLDTYMLYIPLNHSNPVHKEYEFYKNPYSNIVEDTTENILIVPEVNTDFLFNYKNIQKVIWWLSVDNYLVTISRVKFKKKVLNFLLNKKSYYNFDEEKRLFHFVQSFYAKEYLLKKGIKENSINYLSDYLSADFLKERFSIDLDIKKNIVVYNPKKGFEYTSKLINNNPDITFVPIQNMTRIEVIELLKSAKVYIDFGHHPGKDRIPREAAILGCCVITNKKGSAAFFDDVSIQDEYKFDEESSKSEENVIEKIKECFDNFKYKQKDFDKYVKKVLEEEELFLSDIKQIFS